MTSETNPASRLHALLIRLRDGDPNQRMLDAWASIFDLPTPNDVEVSRRLVILNEMLDEAERKIKQNITLNHKVYLACFPQIRAVFAPISIQQSRDQLVRPHITPEVMARLEFCSETLQQSFSEQEIPEEILKEVQSSVDELFDLISESNLDPGLRMTLLEALERARISISLYKIYGAKGLKANLQNLFGITFTEREALKIESKKNDQIIEKLGKLMERIDSISSNALKIHKALTKPIRFLFGLAFDEKKVDGDDQSPSEDAEVIET